MLYFGPSLMQKNLCVWMVIGNKNLLYWDPWRQLLLNTLNALNSLKGDLACGDHNRHTVQEPRLLIWTVSRLLETGVCNFFMCHLLWFLHDMKNGHVRSSVHAWHETCGWKVKDERSPCHAWIMTSDTWHVKNDFLVTSALGHMHT
jgi:hypothetical protein